MKATVRDHTTFSLGGKRAMTDFPYIFKISASVAASGIPRAQLDHAVIIARFAWDCLNKMALIGQSLEVTFGPDTGNLQLRIGIHSGPVTGGFLKGKGARFQLFGDTMNTAIQTAKASERGESE